MEHVAHEIGRDPLDVRIANIDNKYPVLNLISQLKEKSDYESRKKGVQDFNKVRVKKHYYYKTMLQYLNILGV